MKNNLFKLCALLMAATLVIMSGCSKSSNTSQGGNQGAAPNADDQKAAANAKLPKANADTPLDQYAELKSGNQLMFIYYALSNEPVDYENIAQSYVKGYRDTTDAFKKKDMLTAMKPGVDSEIEKAKNLRYIKIEDGVSLLPYDFNAKGFEIHTGIGGMFTQPMRTGMPSAYAAKFGLEPPLPDENISTYTDNGSKGYGYSNYTNFKMLKVADETKAREIEALSKKGDLKLVVYAYAQASVPAFNYTKFQIVKIQLLDNKNNVLASM